MVSPLWVLLCPTKWCNSANRLLETVQSLLNVFACVILAGCYFDNICHILCTCIYLYECSYADEDCAYQKNVSHIHHMNTSFRWWHNIHVALLNSMLINCMVSLHCDKVLWLCESFATNSTLKQFLSIVNSAVGWLCKFFATESTFKQFLTWITSPVYCYG